MVFGIIAKGFSRIKDLYSSFYEDSYEVRTKANKDKAWKLLFEKGDIESIVDAGIIGLRSKDEDIFRTAWSILEKENNNDVVRKIWKERSKELKY